MNTASFSILGLCLGAGIAVAGYFASQTIVNGRTAVNTATVKGLAERIVPADRAEWTIRFGAAETRLGEPNFEPLYQEAERKRDAVLAVLNESGFSTDEISVPPLRYSRTDNRDKDRQYVNTTHYVSGTVKLSTTDFDKITPAFFKMSELPRSGISVVVNAPAYLFSGLNDIKPDMLREATANARIAAVEFAKNADVSVGGIQNAQQGGFSVQDTGSNGGETGTRDKLVRVVTTITFYLDN